MNHRIYVGTTVYFSAFLPDEPKVFYMCQGEVTKLPQGDSHSYRVRITGVGATSVYSKEETQKQKQLLGRAFNKQKLQTTIGSLLEPKQWFYLLKKDNKNV